MMDLDPEARRVLELAREARTPSVEDKERVARRLAAGLGLSVVAGAAGAAAQGATASAAKSAGAAVALKWWVAGGAIVAATLGGYAALSGEPRDDAGRAPRATAHVPPVQTVQPKATEPAVAAPLTEAVAKAEPAVDSARPPVEHPLHRRRTGVAATSPAELELLHEAQAAWRARDARGALSLLEAHRARYPRSTLRSEREGLQVLSLCELGRKSEAARVARRLLEHAPNSPLRAAIEQSCALQ
jgi:hypothetical protein